MLNKLKEDEDIISRPEASILVRWMLEKKGIQVQGGWLELWRLTPAQIADKFNLTTEEILKAAKRK